MPVHYNLMSLLLTSYQIPSSWVNPTGQYHIGIKAVYELLPDQAKDRLKVFYCMVWNGMVWYGMEWNRMVWQIDCIIAVCRTCRFLFFQNHTILDSFSNVFNRASARRHSPRPSVLLSPMPETTLPSGRQTLIRQLRYGIIAAIFCSFWSIE